ncbi:hypothetical protein [Bacillus sp. ISL-37]|uniref:hypothetical protein n=1 Tax=Bacillus sp. ISL-37 TaxID=2819123 RepID=UPI001BE75906|nr:hypothetical protein [Bacillus sp. ISL-37]
MAKFTILLAIIKIYWRFSDFIGETLLFIGEKANYIGELEIPNDFFQLINKDEENNSKNYFWGKHLDSI